MMEQPTDEEISDALRAPLAAGFFQEARDFLQSKLLEAVANGHLSAATSIDIFKTFSRHFATIIKIAESSPYLSDKSNAAFSALTVTLAAYAAGARDAAFLTKIRQRDNNQRTAHARTVKSRHSSLAERDSIIIDLVQKYRGKGEDLSIRKRRFALATKIKPALDARIGQMLKQGTPTKELSVEGLAKRIENMVRDGRL